MNICRRKLTELLILYATSLDTIVTSEGLFLFDYLFQTRQGEWAAHNAVIILLDHPFEKETDPVLQPNAGS